MIIQNISVCVAGHKMLADGSCSEQKSVIYNPAQINVEITSDGQFSLQVQTRKASCMNTRGIPPMLPSLRKGYTLVLLRRGLDPQSCLVTLVLSGVPLSLSTCEQTNALKTLPSRNLQVWAVMTCTERDNLITHSDSYNESLCGMRQLPVTN